LPPMELPPAGMGISSETETPLAVQLLPIEESDDFDHNTFQSEADICTDPLNESLLLQEDDWFPLLPEDQEFCCPDLDDMAILLGQMVDVEKPTLPANLQEPGIGFVNTVDVSISRELPNTERGTETTKHVEADTNLRKESDLDNPSSLPAIENELPLNATNELDVNASIPDLAIPANTSPFMVAVVCQHKVDTMLLPEERHNTQETEINELKKIVDLNPRNAMAWDALGSLHKTNGQYQDAIFAYEQATSIETNNASFHYHLGLIYAAANRNEDALRLFKKVIDLDPNYGLAHATLSNYYRRMGLEELARQHINKALNNTFQNENEYNRACLESICGNEDRALEYLELALQNQQSYADWALHDPDLDFVRNDPRFKVLIAKYTTGVRIDDEQRYDKVQIGCS
jgi:tetratricopeptide (TPR) repeat protein